MTLTGPYRELYDVLQAKAKADLSRMSGTEIADLADNETLARDIGAMPLESVAQLLQLNSSPGRVW